MAYSNDLLNGDWQRLRLKVLERDNFKCRICGFKDNLQVHHLYYKSGFKPWQYEIESLVTVCDKHHTEIHELAKISGIIAFKILTKEIDPLNENICQIHL